MAGGRGREQALRSASAEEMFYGKPLDPGESSPGCAESRLVLKRCRSASSCWYVSPLERVGLLAHRHGQP